MRTIQIAPNESDCRIDGRKVIGTMGDRTFVYEFPERVRMPEDEKGRGLIVYAFCAMIAMSSKGRQVEDGLNRAFGIKGGKFYEQSK